MPNIDHLPTPGQHWWRKLNLAIRNSLVALKLFLNVKSSLSLWTKWQIGHRKWFLNTNLFLIKPFIIAKFDCISFYLHENTIFYNMKFGQHSIFVRRNFSEFTYTLQKTYIHWFCKKKISNNYYSNQISCPHRCSALCIWCTHVVDNRENNRNFSLRTNLDNSQMKG